MLNLSQSTVSRRVQLLERRLGAPLFDRDKSGARLTPIGARFLRDASPGAALLAQAAEKLVSARQTEVRHLRIGIACSLSRGPLMDLLRLCCTKSSKITVTIEELSSVKAKAAVRSGRLDVAIMATTSRISGCESRQIFKEPLYVALPAEHRLTDKPHLRWSDLVEEVLLVRADIEGPDLHARIMREFANFDETAKVKVLGIGRQHSVPGRLRSRCLCRAEFVAGACVSGRRVRTPRSG